MREGDPLYNERLATEFTQFDLAKANEALDKVVPKKDSEGYRLDASGRRVTIVFETDQNRQAIATCCNSPCQC